MYPITSSLSECTKSHKKEKQPVVKITDEASLQLTDLVQVLIYVVTCDGGVCDELKQLTNSHNGYIMLLEKVWENQKNTFKNICWH